MSGRLPVMFKELDAVMLACDLPEHGLVRGDVGAIVLGYGKGEAYEVEFVNSLGGTVALLMLKPSDIRPLPRRFIRHVRELAEI